MFEFPAGISFTADSLIVLLFLNAPWIHSNQEPTPSQLSVYDLNPLNSIFLFILLAGLRIFLFLPYIWLYYHDRRLVLAQAPYLWHTVNFSLLILKACWEISHQTWDLFLWYILLGSTVSVCCQTICLRHLISSALPERHVILGIVRNLENEEPILPTTPTSSKSDRDIIEAIRLSLKDVRREWDQKIEKLTNAIADLKISSGLSETVSDESAVFDELLDLFTQSHTAETYPPPTKTISNLTKLYTMYPETVEFYIPQLTVFLLYGSFDITSLLQEAIFQICEVSLTFAHKLHWFVVSFCLSGAGVSPEGVVALHRLLQDLETHGMVSARRIKEGFLTDTSHVHPSENGEGEEKMSLLRYEHGPNVLHYSSSPAYFNSLLEKCVPIPDSLNEFSATIAFWETLSELSLFLGSIPRDTRTEELRNRIEPIQKRFLPSSTIYSPVTGTGQHRIFGIQIEESFAFSTKERAPMLICFEIIELSPNQKREIARSGLGAWLTEIRDGFKRAFLPQPQRQSPREPEDDIEAPAESREAKSGGVVESESPKIAGSFCVSPTFKSDVGQWCEPSPTKLTTRASFDSYHNRLPRGEKEISPRRSLGTPLPSVRLVNNEFPNPNNPIQEEDPNGEEYREVKDPLGAPLWSLSVDDDPGVGLDKQGRPLPMVVFKERWSMKEERIRSSSPIGHVPGYKLVPVIVKSNDDLRQEQCAGQLISQIYSILLAGEVDCWLRPYGIIALSPSSGLIEAIPDTVSFDVLRRKMPEYIDLKHFFEIFFGEEDTPAFGIARENFIRSLATYCIVCYLLQIKDRHNGNILLDRFGHVIHIDFGFILGSTPGGNIGFESAPFKLTAEMVDLMGGVRSPHFHRFCDICTKTFMELRRHHHKIVLLLEMISVGNEHLPFFLGNPQRTLEQLRGRFRPEVHDQAAIEHVQHLINLATDNWTTTCYDRFQRCCVGVL